MDSHVKFFEMMGGSYREVVYDNMRNVVSKFIGRNEKELNEDSRMEEEKERLRPYRPPLELALISEAKVNPSSLVSVDTVLYSVPEHLVGSRVIVKKYHNEVRIYANNELIAQHKRLFGNGKMQIDIYHYLNTLRKKPGAIRNSVALKSIPRLKAIFDTYYAKQPKKFIELFLENKKLPIDEIIELFENETKNKGEIDALDVVKPISQIVVSARAFIANYAALVYGGAQ